MTWCCQPKVDSVIHLLSIGRCQSLSATPSPVLRLWLPVLKASFDVVQLCNLGSGCCEKSTGKPCRRPPWFCLAVACLSFVWELLAWALLPVLGHLPRWSWSWPTDLTSWLEPRPAALIWTWVAVVEVCLTLATISGRLCSPGSGIVRVVPHVSEDTACAYPVMLSSWLTLQSCCSLTLKALFNSL